MQLIQDSRDPIRDPASGGLAFVIHEGGEGVRCIVTVEALEYLGGRCLTTIDKLTRFHANRRLIETAASRISKVSLVGTGSVIVVTERALRSPTGRHA